MHLPPIPRFLARWSIRLVLVVLFLGLPVALLYLREVGVGFGLKDRVEEALSGKTFQTTIGKLSLDPFQGLIAKDVEVVELKGRQRSLAQVARLAVSVNFADLLSRKISIDHIVLDDTDVSIPMGSGSDATRLTLTNVSAQCLFFADQMRISYFEGNVQGIQVLLSGLLKNPQAFHLENRPASSASSDVRQPLADLVGQLSQLQYPGARPTLSAEISGDLADPSTVALSPITLRSGPVIAPKWRLAGLQADADYENKILTVHRLELRDRSGMLKASARWNGKTLDFEVSNTMLPGPFLDLLPGNFPREKLKFHEAPQFEAAGWANLAASPPQYNVTGSVRFGKFSWQGVEVDSLSADFALRNGRFFVRDAHLLAEKGEITADVLLTPDDFRLRLTNTIAPTVFIPMLGPKEQEFLQMMEFKDQPYVEIELRGPTPALASLEGTGFLRLGRTAMRGSWLDWGQAKLEIADRAVTYRDFSLGLGDAEGSGTFVYDFGRHQVLLHDIKSTMPPVDVMMWIDPKIAEAIKPYRFRKPPTVHAEGMVHMTEASKNDLRLKIESNEGLDYDLLNRTLKFGRTVADVHVDGRKVRANVKSAKLMGGEVGIRAVVSIDASDPTFGADVEIRRVNFARLTNLYFNYDDSKGVVSGNFKFTARMGQEEKMRGAGNIRVEDGQVFAIPILGPLSPIIDKIIPGVGLHRASLATADFTVANEKIHTDNLDIQGENFSLFGKGDIAFMSDKLDMSVRINARGLPGLVLFPVSKLFEYVSTGSVSDPEWRPKIIPRFDDDE